MNSELTIYELVKNDEVIESSISWALIFFFQQQYGGDIRKVIKHIKE